MLTYKAFQQLMTASVKFNLVPLLSLLLWAQIYERKLSDRFYMKARIVSTSSRTCESSGIIIVCNSSGRSTEPIDPTEPLSCRK